MTSAQNKEWLRQQEPEVRVLPVALGCSSQRTSFDGKEQVRRTVYTLVVRVFLLRQRQVLNERRNRALLQLEVVDADDVTETDAKHTQAVTHSAVHAPCLFGRLFGRRVHERSVNRDPSVARQIRVQQLRLLARKPLDAFTRFGSLAATHACATGWPLSASMLAK